MNARASSSRCSAAGRSRGRSAAQAQQPDRMRRIGVLVGDSLEPLGRFREGLGDLGYIDGKNIQIEVRSAGGQDTRLPELAAELVRSRVDIIVAVQTPAAHAAKNATRDIPIVVMAGDPIATGLITNLARPDGNLTRSVRHRRRGRSKEPRTDH